MTIFRITPRILAGLLPLLILLVIREACEACEAVFTFAERIGNAANDIATRLGLWMRLDGDFWE